MKKVVRILAVAAVVAASYSAYSTPVTKGTTLSEGSMPRPSCPVSICGNPGLTR